MSTRQKRAAQHAFYSRLRNGANSVDQRNTADRSTATLTDKKAERHADGHEWTVAVAEGHQEDADAAQQDAEVVDEERVDARKVRDETGEDAAQCVGDADHRQQEGCLVRLHALPSQRVWLESSDWNAYNRRIAWLTWRTSLKNKV